MKIIVTEEQIKEIINNVYGNILSEQTKPTFKNQTYTTTQDRLLTKDTLTASNGLKIPKGTIFTAHQNGDKKITTPTYTASVDKITNGKNKPSTIYYCNGTNAGKFWNDASKSLYYDKSKVLLGLLIMIIFFNSSKLLEKKKRSVNSNKLLLIFSKFIFILSPG